MTTSSNHFERIPRISFSRSTADCLCEALRTISALLPSVQTLNPWKPSEDIASSAAPTRSSSSSVRRTPWSTLVARQELESLFHVLSLLLRASLLIWLLESPASLRGDLMPSSPSALMPGRTPESSDALVPSATTEYPRAEAAPITALNSASLHR